MTGNTLRWLVLIAVVAVAGTTIFEKYQQTRPCVETITYALGAVDPRFEISNARLLEAAKEAATIWNAEAGKILMTYHPEAELKINLIYDEREATARLGIEITKAQEESDVARAALEALRAQVTAAEKAYNQKVNTINARGGATKAEAAALAEEREYLQSLVNSLNRKIASFNASIAALNTKVREYNQVAGKTFEQGQYVLDASGERINIFVFTDTTQLKRVLAHEFGHAIGLGHNDDPDAIMYAKNESGNLVLTEADIVDLKAVCRLK
jgi:hypothetical protein